MSARCQSCHVPVPAGTEICTSCRTSQVPRIDLDPLLGSIGEAPVPSATSSELSPDQEVPWCGRSSELQQLLKLAEQMLQQQRLRSFLVLGAPGLGKSRLLRELGRMIVRHLGVSKTRVLSATVPGEGAAAHSVFMELFFKRFEILPGESAHSARDKILRACRSLLPAVRATEVAHLLGELLQLPFPDSPVLSASTGALQLGRTEPRTYAAIRRFLAADARRSPLVLLLDEMEHAGAETMSLLHYLLDGLQDLPVLIGVAARPEFVDSHPDFGTTTVVPERLELTPLPAEDAIELLGGVVGADPEELPEPLIRHLGEAFDGSPRAVVELVRLLVETGALSWLPARESAGADEDQPLLPQWDGERLVRGELPTSFAGLVQARLQAMAPAPRTILEQAAVVGEHFYLGAVRMLARCDAARLGGELAEDSEAITDPDGPPLDEVIDASERNNEESDLLAQLQSQGVVLQLPGSQLRGEHEYRFAYPPWQETIYRATPPDRRRRYHHLIAQWLRLCPERERQEVQESIGRHLERAGLGSEAAPHYRRAAALAVLHGAWNRVPRLLLRALACLDAAEVSMRLELWQELGSALWRIGDTDAALPSFHKVVRLAYAMAARAQAAQAFSAIGLIHRQKGDMSHAIENLTRALELHQQLDDQVGWSDALDDVGQVLWLLGRADEALDRCGRALELRRRLGDRRKIATSLLHIGGIEQHRGLLDAAVACFDEAQRKHEGDPLIHAACLEALGSVELVRGEVPAARARFEEALQLCEPMGPSAQLAGLICRLGEALVQEGLLGEAESRLVQARELAFRISDRRALAEIMRLLGLIHFRRDDQKAALDYCHKALDRAQQSGLRYELGHALLSLGEVHAATLFDVSSEGEHPAWEYFRRAVTLLREIGDQAELTMALAALGRHLIERGRRGPGRATLREAIELGTGLRMRVADELQHVLADL